MVLVVGLALFLVVSSTRRILTFKSTAGKVSEAQANLDNLKKENEDLKKELDFKSSQQFAEEEIRNKLGLVKQGENLVVLPKEENSNQGPVTSNQKLVTSVQNGGNSQQSTVNSEAEKGQELKTTDGIVITIPKGQSEFYLSDLRDFLSKRGGIVVSDEIRLGELADRIYEAQIEAAAGHRA